MSSIFPCFSFASGLDLHAHLFMSKGLGPLFQGDFYAPLRASKWSDRFKSQINEASLISSELSLVVVSLYAHPFFCWDARECIRSQIQELETFLSKAPEWTLALSADEAREAFRKKKKVLLVGLEGIKDVLETESDLEEFVYEGPVRIAGAFHLTDDQYGGAAFLSSYRVLANPWAYLQSLWSSPSFQNQTRLNTNGLSSKGKEWIEKLLKAGVWLDLTHGSDKTLRELKPLLKQYDHPPLFSHTSPRTAYRAERGLSAEHLKWVKSENGIVGLMPSADMLKETEVGSECEGTLAAFLWNWRQVADVLGERSTLIGSDFNGTITHLKPGCATSEDGPLLSEGLWNIGQLRFVWQAIEKYHRLPKNFSRDAIDHFLTQWKRAQAPLVTDTKN